MIFPVEGEEDLAECSHVFPTGNSEAPRFVPWLAGEKGDTEERALDGGMRKKQMGRKG